jgi:hypothetical protein
MLTTKEASYEAYFAEPLALTLVLRLAMDLRPFGSRGSLGSVRRFSCVTGL